MKCSKCGAELEEGALFCGSCGAKVETEAAPEAPESEAEQPAQSVQTAEDSPEAKVEAPAPIAPVVPPITAPSSQAPAPRPAPVSGAQPQPRPIEPEGQSVSLGVWLCRRLINFIPCVGPLVYLVMLFVWSFDKKYDDTSRNWARSELIFAALGIILSIIFIVAIVSFFSVSGYGDILEDAIEHGAHGRDFYYNYYGY